MPLGAPSQGSNHRLRRSKVLGAGSDGVPPLGPLDGVLYSREASMPRPVLPLLFFRFMKPSGEQKPSRQKGRCRPLCRPGRGLHVGGD